MRNTIPEQANLYEVHIQVDEAFAGAVDSESVARAVRATLRQEGVDGRPLAVELTVEVTDDEAVRALNREFRDVDAPTDVLSFANMDSEFEGADGFVLPAELADEMATYLGDIVIAFPYAARQAGRYGNSTDAELRLLAVHGTLHLLGYDHDTPEAESAMWAAQERVLAQFGDRGLSERSYDD